ncbi:MAG: glycosyltransferase family 4 protein [Acidobacteria bacterium]|nr:glycosyltransferase family 4 protein [Acidobacteriota bacterium]
MKILVDYRPALRERTGVGEYIHELVRAYAAAGTDTVSVFTSSWKDRPATGLAGELGTAVVDRRIPVRALNYLWHRAEWPPVEWLAGDCDVVHAAHPLLIPTRRAARVITIHDVFFLSPGARTHAEIRRDYAPLARAHAHRAEAIVTSTEHGRRLVVDTLGADADRVYVCPPGAPAWRTLGTDPNVPRDGCVLFIGTLDARKNVGALLDAYTRLLDRGSPMAPLVLAGRPTPEAAGWLERLRQPPLAGHARYVGYVAHEERERLYASARVLVLPSLDEGFGLPALEAMSAGVPVIASRRGSLPEVVGTGGLLVEPDDIDGLAAVLERLLTDDREAAAWGRAGLARARAFSWTASAATLRRAYTDAIGRRRAQ